MAIARHIGRPLKFSQLYLAQLTVKSLCHIIYLLALKLPLFKSNQTGWWNVQKAWCDRALFEESTFYALLMHISVTECTSFPIYFSVWRSLNSSHNTIEIALTKFSRDIIHLFIAVFSFEWINWTQHFLMQLRVAKNYDAKAFCKIFRSWRQAARKVILV